ncbi:Poly(A) polymerase [Penicillium mononematosum]|uniref:Poly(A) polymerase n=1 Tax=Penicillium mononematosum TaxID=268346 RepID=UPI0025490710|nr:Poly(A) polymerase [Penicillium mononematosum]KAJ6191403.1 Poly(A) polymerase [Penicillium mononematosum]
MATPPVRQWGVTPPISTVLPTKDELSANDDLIAELKAQNNFELPTETERRKQVLQLLQRVTVEFVQVVSRKKGLSLLLSRLLGVKFLPMEVTGWVYTDPMTPVPDAFVPIIKLELCGISIDLIFARLVIPSIPMNLDLKNNDYLRGLDEREVRSLNGTRVTDEILELVPQQKTFRLALRAIKLWAQRRAIYSNIVGFPGGVAWAMLVARVCQLYPQATGSVIVGKFFRIMNKWNWPQPVLLKQIEDGPLQIKVWNPKIYHGDRFHLMPIITPAYPSMCATHNISMSTKAVILRELQRGGDMVDKIFMKQLSWHDLFARHTFFTHDYKYYLSITASSKTKEAESVWSGLVESKLRHLVGALDRKPIIAVAHPFPKGFERVHLIKNEKDMEAVKNGSTQHQAQGTKTAMTDETKDAAHQAAVQNTLENAEVPGPAEGKVEGTVDNEGQTVYTTTYYIGLELKPLEPGQSRSLDISTDSQIFKSTCTSWPGYQEEVMELAVTHVRSFDLPDDVFQPGETRPSTKEESHQTVRDSRPETQHQRVGRSNRRNRQTPSYLRNSRLTGSLSPPFAPSIPPGLVPNIKLIPEPQIACGL